MRPAIVLAGFMGAGKTTAARDLAAVLGEPAQDTDRLLERELGSSIEAYFDRHGEAAFREREAALVASVLDRADGGIVALGGGALGSARVREALGRHVVAWLRIDLATAWRRAHGRGRPLARDRRTFEARFREREALYAEHATAVLPATAPGVARGAARHLAALRDLPPGTRLLWGRGGRRQYPVFVGRDLLDALPGAPTGRRVVVTDEHLAESHAGRVGRLSGLVEIPPGEQAKTLATAERVWEALVALELTRADHLVAVGGGVVGDLAGFCAATYQRGIDVVQVPTTLVAQVDSAYGGKTGVDLPTAKNYVGAYHHPVAVVTDVSTLATLPPEEHAAGYAEVVKTALIAGGELWDRVGAGEPVDEAVIRLCVQTKLDTVAADERDGGRRQVLNLGHTVGHAIETVTGYARYRHGEAVALGLLAALRLSGQQELRSQVRGLLEQAGLPVALDPAIDPDAVVAATRSDKKRVGEGSTPFVLVEAPGDVRHGAAIGPEAVRAAVVELRGSA